MESRADGRQDGACQIMRTSKEHVCTTGGDVDMPGLEALGVVARDSTVLEQEIVAQWQEQAEQQRAKQQREHKKKRLDKTSTSSMIPALGSDSPMATNAVVMAVVPQGQGTEFSCSPTPEPSVATSSVVGAVLPRAAHTSTTHPSCIHGTGDEGLALSIEASATQLDTDAELARALASQRSDRLLVARKRAVSSISQHDDAQCSSESSDGSEFLPADDSGRGDSDGDDDDDVDDGDNDTEDESESEDAVLPETGVNRRRGSVATRPDVQQRRGSRARVSRNTKQRSRCSRLHAQFESPYRDSDDEAEDHALSHAFRVPGRLWKHLLEHQRICLQWLCGLHMQQVGGIIGDEMCVCMCPRYRLFCLIFVPVLHRGLGKTLQVVSLVATLQHSTVGGACLVVAPATVLRQWEREFRRWAPEINPVALLHSSVGVDQDRLRIVQDVCAANGGQSSVLITSYEMMRQHASLLLAQRWLYVVLDEGHKIRNPDAEVTLIAKRVNTGHRLILTGAPIQNKLSELWSLFDFIFPGKLGTLPTFEEQFALPIANGAYANASAFKVDAAFQCSLVLRNLIRPYLLRRTKADVDLKLPGKSEHVLFCQLTDEQRLEYERFLQSDIVSKVLAGKANAFAALGALLKICNHPHLLHHAGSNAERGQCDAYGDWKLSGKLCVVKQVTFRLCQHERLSQHSRVLTPAKMLDR